MVTVIDMGGVGPGGLDLPIAAFEHFKVSLPVFTFVLMVALVCWILLPHLDME